jgi:hypothetical protein
MRNGAVLAIFSVTAIASFTGLRAAFSGQRGSRSYASMASIKEANLGADGVFFRPAMMEIFQTRIEAGPFQGRFFVTSDQFTSMRGKSYPRRYTVREALPDGSIGTVGEFQQHGDEESAVKAAQEAA